MHIDRGTKCRFGLCELRSQLNRLKIEGLFVGTKSYIF